jgi:hypothetical protein
MSSRRLERESNVEVMWLIGRLVPDHKTIADFRKNNGPAIRKVCVQFVALCRQMGQLTKANVAIDGSKCKAVNNRDKNLAMMMERSSMVPGTLPIAAMTVGQKVAKERGSKSSPVSRITAPLRSFPLLMMPRSSSLSGKNVSASSISNVGRCLNCTEHCSRGDVSSRKGLRDERLNHAEQGRFAASLFGRGNDEPRRNREGIITVSVHDPERDGNCSLAGHHDMTFKLLDNLGQERRAVDRFCPRCYLRECNRAPLCVDVYFVAPVAGVQYCLEHLVQFANSDLGFFQACAGQLGLTATHQDQVNADLLAGKRFKVLDRLR